MEKLTFGAKSSTSGVSFKLCICNDTKEFEEAQYCVNTDYVDVWVTKKDLNTIKISLLGSGYKETNKRFGSSSSSSAAIAEVEKEAAAE